jgi:hypothetical protein
MGMDQKVIFPTSSLPPWAQFADLLAQRKLPVQLRMIDDELALPDETPPHDWRELRVGTPAGMVTMRRDTDGVTLVIFGNADLPMRQSWNALAWALGSLTGGAIQTAGVNRSAAEFAKVAELPPGFV